jgi:hypothetical protein
VAVLLCGPAAERLIAPGHVVPRALVIATPSASPPIPRTSARPRIARRIPSHASSPFSVPVTDLASLPGTSVDLSVVVDAPVLPSQRIPLRLPEPAISLSKEVVPVRPRAPRVLRPLYVSFGTLQALDYHSTGRALESGAGREANPLARGIMQSPPALIVAKAAATAGVIVAGEKMWKKNRAGAVLFVAGMNVAMGIIVAHNYSVGVPKR